MVAEVWYNAFHLSNECFQLSVESNLEIDLVFHRYAL